jgi:hypothetical protein
MDGEDGVPPKVLYVPETVALLAITFSAPNAVWRVRLTELPVKSPVVEAVQYSVVLNEATVEPAVPPAFVSNASAVTTGALAPVVGLTNEKGK